MSKLGCLLVAALTPALAAQTFAVQNRSVFDPPPATPPAVFFDFDGDGDVDMLTEGTPSQSYRNEGHGRFSLHGGIATQIASNLVTTGDLDADGDSDLIVGPQIYDNDGTGGFQLRAVLPGLLTSTRVADADGDGDLDLFLLSSTLQYYENDGSGTFTNATATALPQPIAAICVLTFDADSDGDPDVYYSTTAATGLLRNDGSGQFTPDPTTPLPLAFLNRILAGDFNGDGHLDVWVFSLGFTNRVLLNDGTGSFQPLPQPVATPDFEFAFANATDWDLDGYTDLVAGGGIHRFGPGATSTFERFPYVFEISGALVADIDGDLDDDLAFASADPTGFVVRNAQGQPHPVNRPSATEPRPFTSFHDAKTESPDRDDLQVLVANGGYPVMLNNVGATFAYGYQPLQSFPPTFQDSTTDAALVRNRFHAHWTQMVACTSFGPVLQQWNVSTLIDQSQILPAIGTPQFVDADQLDGIAGDELVFGDAAHDGPRILTRDLSGMFVEIGPTFPAAPASSIPVHETVVLADFDGDGHRDILHEQRLLLSDGQGGWSVGADISSLASPHAERFVALDHDRDGDADLVCYGANAPTQLLRNDGASFVDATIGTIPPPEFAASALVTAGDLDGDGDLDLLTTRNGRSHVLRNDGGVFTRVPDVAPFGALVDVDRDGRADIYTGEGVFTNLRTNLFAPFPAIPGTDWRLNVTTWRVAPSLQTAVVAIGTSELPVTVPNVGDVFVDLATADVVPLALQQGRGSLSLPIPLSVLLLGTELIAQGAVVDAAGVELTAPVRDTIL